MDLLNNKTDSELLSSMIGELAKAQNEIRCAARDVDKASNRIRFLIAVVNTLQDRHKD